MLHVPNITASMISVHRFASDNNCIYEFNASDFCVKDKATEKMLFRERSESGLYPFSMSSSYSNKASPTAPLEEKVSAFVWHSRLGHPAS